MKSKLLQTSFILIVFSLWSAVSISFVFAQSQALNGQIEGTVSDQNKAVVPNALITAANIETGATRTVSTDESGVYRFPLLPLGAYRLTAEAANYKKVVREGVILTTGQTATVDFSLPAGDLREVVTVTADSSIADAGKTDLGRVMDAREVKNLPLISRNPYNFALLQANVTGRPSPGNPFPTVNANGYLRRVNYLLDGNTNTQADRAGVRLMLITESMVSEVQLITGGFAAEFGNTPGLIMNVVTPSGTNDYRGAVSYRFSRTPFYARPFFYNSPEDLPENNSDNLTATVGGALIRNRWHFFGGYEWIERDDNIGRLVTIKPSDRAELIALGLPASIFPPVIPNSNKNTNYIFRTDAALNKNNLLTGRFIYSRVYSKNFSPQGGLFTLERAADSSSIGYSFGTQIVSYTSNILNELRFQYTRRKSSRLRNEFSGTGPSIVIFEVANFGAPTDANAVNPLEKVTQIQNNLTWTRGAHVIKFGGGFNFIDDLKRAPVSARFIFPSITAYRNALNGTDRRSYTSLIESFGNPETKYKSTFWNFFVQDDWKVTRRLKINYGLRYDLYRIPEADSNSPLRSSQKFNVDRDNFSPRMAIVYALREGTRPTILRAGAGIYYETPWLNMYERALLNNGNPRFFSYTFRGSSGGIRTPVEPAPLFPNTFSGSFPPDFPLPKPDIDTIAPDFENMYAMHTHLQIEQAITNNLSLIVGYVRSAGRQIAVYRNINPIPCAYLADGRPVYRGPTSCSTRFYDTRFNNILIAESAGVSGYNALNLQLNRRFSQGMQFSLHYTLSKATDNAPEQNLSTGDFQNLRLTDPNNRSLDKGRSFADQRHTFVMSLVVSPKLNFENKQVRYLFNNNQFSVIMRANSGETFNIISNLDINGDGVTQDRPVGIARNSGTTPPHFSVDLRYSRFFKFNERHRLEIFGDFTNIFNVNSIISFTSVSVPTNVNGELIAPLPDFRALNKSISQESRQFQLGFKFIF